MIICASPDSYNFQLVIPPWGNCTLDWCYFSACLFCCWSRLLLSSTFVFSFSIVVVGSQLCNFSLRLTIASSDNRSYSSPDCPYGWKLLTYIPLFQSQMTLACSCIFPSVLTLQLSLQWRHNSESIYFERVTFPFPHVNNVFSKIRTDCLPFYLRCRRLNWLIYNLSVDVPIHHISCNGCNTASMFSIKSGQRL